MVNEGGYYGSDEMRLPKYLFLAVGLAALAACGGEPEGAAPQEEAAPDNGAVLATVLAGEHRTDEERARDAFRHPAQTLAFFGIEPDMTVVEAWPGGGWYTQIIAPYLKSGGGAYYGANFSPEGASEYAQTSLNAFSKTYLGKPNLYGDVRMTILGEGGDIAPAGSADVVLTFRNVHNWQSSGVTEAYFKEFYDALKPGGVLGVVEHRADGAELPRDGSSGYVYTDDVIALAKSAGFNFEAASEINANPKDTKDHPFGVWTLPPTRRSAEMHGQEDPDFNQAAYEAIGESDRMTLKFRKPIAADGALLE
jgi:predicted methyltransferase